MPTLPCPFHRSLEYDPRFYSMFFHDDIQLPMEVSMWDHLDETNPSGYQDSLVLHMIHKPVQVSFQKDEERCVCVRACACVWCVKLFIFVDQILR